MAGSILGQDQETKVNDAYAAIYAHIKTLLEGTKKPVDLMRVHVLTEYLDTTELSRIFMGLPFLSPAEKRALVRAAIFDVLTGKEVEGTATLGDVSATITEKVGTVDFKPYTPPAFKLNVITTTDHKVV